MQEPTEEAEAASIPMENASNVRDGGPNLNEYSYGTAIKVRRKVAKRTYPWDDPAPAAELNSVSPPPQAEYTPATKKPRLEEPEPFSASADEVATKKASTDVTMSLPPPAADVDDDDDDDDDDIFDDANTDSVTDTQSNARATWVTRHDWTREEDAKLTNAHMYTYKKKWGEEYKTDWAAVTAAVPDRTKTQFLEGHHRHRPGDWAYGHHRLVDWAYGCMGRRRR
jgi:hypothetical protein